jgi:HSP20 family protein
MDRLFEDFFAPEPRSFARAEAGSSEAMLRPNIEMRETGAAYVVTVEVPGIEQKDIELNLRDNALVVSGEKRSERKEGEEGRGYSERRFGRFERTIPFEAEVDADKVEASCANGVLTITLPKNARAQDKSRRIEIKPQSESSWASPTPGAGSIP